jgi:hypothetical protein
MSLLFGYTQLIKHMPLSFGIKLGPYEILGPIGSDGMGEVYRSRDTKLKRDVALKVLLEAFARDPERMARFQREAEVLARQSSQHRGDLRSRGPRARDGVSGRQFTKRSSAV